MGLAESYDRAHRLLIFRFAAMATCRNTAWSKGVPPHKADAGVLDMVREAPAEPPPPPKAYPAEKARGGEIILRTPLQRWVFIAGLVGAVVLVLVLALLR
jgi:hypothetical protein